MHNPAPVQENDTHKLLWDFDRQTDHLISARRQDLIIINKKKICKIVDFAVPADHRIKLKECEKSDKYLDFSRELKKLWKVTICYILICRFMQKESQWYNDKRTSEDFFRKIYTSHFIVMFVCERELETEQNCNILTPLLWPSAFCLSCSPDAPPKARGLSFLLSAGFLYHILSPTGLRNYWGPRGPLRPGVAFPTTSYQQPLWTPTVCLPVFTELFNSSTPTQSLE